MPIWQISTAALSYEEPSVAYYSHSPPISPFITGPSASSSVVPSPNLPMFPQNNSDSYFTTPGYDQQVLDSKKSSQSSPPGVAESIDNDETIEDEDSDTFSWDSKLTANASSAPKRPPHRRTQSYNEVSFKNAKRAHTVVEKNYRERLNDKIADLAVYLFETSSDCKPSILCSSSVLSLGLMTF